MQILQTAFEARNKKQNKIEKLKDIKTMEQAMQDLKAYASLGYEAIKNEDLTYYFKCFGIFDKKKENGENSFMIRVRIPGGQITATQAKVLGEVSRDYCKDSLDITNMDRMELLSLIVNSEYTHIIVVHGTDTMAYTASALSFMLENLGKTVILTGSQVCIQSWKYQTAI